MPSFLLIPFGSDGDVFPFLGLGRSLQQRGHDLTIAVNEHFLPAVERAGMPFVQMGTAEQFLSALDNPDLWHPRRGLNAIFGNPLMQMATRMQVDVIRERLAADPNLIVVAGTLAIGARIAREVMPFKLVTVHLQPSMLFSAINPPSLPGSGIPSWAPAWVYRSAYWFAHRVIIDPLARQAVGSLSKELGTQPIRDCFTRWVHSPDLCLALFPDWYASGPDWPQQLRTTEFPIYDDAQDQPLAAEIEAFLSAGPPPVVATFGTSMTQGRKLFAAAVEACAALKRRAILLTKFDNQVPDRLPEGIVRFRYAPLSRLLPRASALVFHGGIGTMARGLKAGLPMVVVPLGFDQPDNARRLGRLNVARSGPATRLTETKLTRLLQEVLANPSVASACRHAAERMYIDDPFAKACEQLEHFSNSVIR